MNLRKINAIISILIVLLFLDHSIFYSVVMLSRYRIPVTITVLPRLMVMLTIIHATLSIALAILAHKGTGKQKYNTYGKLNVLTLIQRISGILMILLLIVHLAGSVNHFQPKLLHAVLHPIFFAVVLIHLAISASKAFITLGVGNAKFIKTIDVIMRVFCCLIFLACVVGFYLCLFMGVAR